MITANELFAKGRELLSKTYPVPVPDFPEGLFVRMMDGAGKGDFEQCLSEQPKDNPAEFRAALLKWTVQDANGNLIFADTELSEIKKLPPLLTEPLVDVAMDINGYSKRDREQIEKK